MAKDLSEQLGRIGHKAELLVTRYATLRDDNTRLRDEVVELKARIHALEAENEKLVMQLEFLRLRSTIAPDSQATLKARDMITNLVRDIDACVADLMKDI